MNPFRRLNQVGLLSLPLGLALVGLSVGTLGVIAIQRDWRTLTQTQLRIDRCVATTAHALKTRLIQIEKSNRRIHALRGLILAAGPGGLTQPAIQAARAALLAEVARQDALLAGWLAKQGLWLAKQGCDQSKGDVPMPLPALPWSIADRGPADWIGPQALADESAREELYLQLSHPPRHSAALVRKEAHPNSIGEIMNGTSPWQTQWTAPRIPASLRIGPDFY